MRRVFSGDDQVVMMKKKPGESKSQSLVSVFTAMFCLLSQKKTAHFISAKHFSKRMFPSVPRLGLAFPLAPTQFQPLPFWSLLSWGSKRAK